MRDSPARATPPAGVDTEILGSGTTLGGFKTHAGGIKVESKHAAGVTVAHLTFAPGGTTGWHVHAGPVLVIVQTGAVTKYPADDCTAQTYTAGQAFAENGPADENMIRNDGSVLAETIVMVLTPPGAPIRDAPPPGCTTWPSAAADGAGHRRRQARRSEGEPMTNTSHPAPSRRRLAAAGLALAGLLGTVFLAAAAQASQPAHPAATTSATAGQTIQLVAHEKQRKFLNEGGFGDEEIFRGILDNATGTTQIGIFAGTLTSISAGDSLNLATVDLQLPGGQITVQGFADFTQPRLIHAITGGTGRYTGADGEFSFTSPSPGVLDMTLTIQD
jgi:hypothetical protein